MRKLFLMAFVAIMATSCMAAEYAELRTGSDRAYRFTVELAPAESYTTRAFFTGHAYDMADFAVLAESTTAGGGNTTAIIEFEASYDSVSEDWFNTSLSDMEWDDDASGTVQTITGIESPYMRATITNNGTDTSTFDVSINLGFSFDTGIPPSMKGKYDPKRDLTVKKYEVTIGAGQTVLIPGKTFIEKASSIALFFRPSAGGLTRSGLWSHFEDGPQYDDEGVTAIGDLDIKTVISKAGDGAKYYQMKVANPTGGDIDLEITIAPIY